MYITTALFTLKIQSSALYLLASTVSYLSLPLVSLPRTQLGQRESDDMLTPAPDLSNSFAMLGVPTRAATYNGLDPLISCELTLDPDLTMRNLELSI